MMSYDSGRFTADIALLEEADLERDRRAMSRKPVHLTTQPVHVMYGGAHLFKRDLIKKIGLLAQKAFAEAAPEAQSLKTLLREDWSASFASEVYSRVVDKLYRDPVEDYRIDFEDGYGVRPDAEEDLHAKTAAQELVAASIGRTLSGMVGIRIKPLGVSSLKRSLRTLVIFVEEFVRAGGSKCAIKHLRITLPKVTSSKQVSALSSILSKLEEEHGLNRMFFLLEALIETPEAIISDEGRIQLLSIVEAGSRRLVSLHFGVFDFTSSIGIGSAGQATDHVSCDFARIWMQMAAALSPGVGLSDGIINIIPTPPHRISEGVELTPQELAENFISVGEAWRYNYKMIIRSLKNGFYQGWDLHPSQLPIRHVANHAYVLREMPMSLSRLKTFVERAAQASRVGSMFDDRASALGLVNFVSRAMSSGILTEADLATHGLTISDLVALT